MSARLPYSPLWCKSNYSFLEGAGHPEEIVETCARMGINSVALTDRDGVYGIVRAHVAAKDHGVHLIVGSEMTVESGGTVVLLARTKTGYANLCKLITAGRLRNEKGTCTVTIDEIAASPQGLFALLPTGNGSVEEQNVWQLKRAFASNLFLIISRHRTSRDPERERHARHVADKYHVEMVAAAEVLYHDKARKPLQDVLCCIKHGVVLDNAGTLLTPNDEHDLKSPESFFELYQDDPALISKTQDIALQCTFSLDELVYRYPSELLPEGFTTFQWLEHLTTQGARKRYGGAVPRNVQAQMQKELDLINRLDYCGYFLTMWDIVEYCRKNGILCQGRGSAANSIVCFCLGITAVDPVRMDLLFERFISEERAEPPDIDLDIEHRRREEVIQHMYRKYGRSHAAMVANVIRYRLRSAVREVGKALGISVTTIDRLSRLVSYRDGTLDTAIREAGLSVSADRLELLAKLVEEIQEFPRHLSIHPGGFLLGSGPVSEIVPIENATMPDRTVIQWDKYDVEELGLFKVDLLGLGALTHLHYAVDLIDKYCGKRYTMATIPPNDPATFTMLRNSDTVGVFQLESRAQMSMLPRLLPNNYYDIVVEISIVRPGPITGGMVHPYLRRRNGEEEVAYPHPSLEPVLKKTLGVPIFQEQVMKLAIIAAGYTPGEADQLRRDMAAWRIRGNIDRHREKLIAGMRANSISEEFAEQVFQQIRGFGEYGFPESHAASFALIAYATAWLKCRFPVIFACALLNAWPMGFYSPATIVADAKRHGITFLPVDVFDSDWECTLVPAGSPSVTGTSPTPPHRFPTPPAPNRSPSVTGTSPTPPGLKPAGAPARAGGDHRPETPDAHLAIRMGLRYVKGLGKADYAKIESARKHRPSSVAEFISISGLSESALNALSHSGALESLGLNRREALWAASGARAYRSDVDGNEPVLDAAEAPLPFEDLDDTEIIYWDHSHVGHSTRGHPLEPYRAELQRRGLPDASEVSQIQPGSRVSYVGLVICRQRPGTAGGTVFMTMEDETGFVNCIIWESIFQRFRSEILTNSVLGVSGKLQRERGVCHVVVDRCWTISLSAERAPAKSRDFH